MFYTYFHTRNDTGVIFYVGKGKGKRHLSKAGRNKDWLNIANTVGFTSHTGMTHLTEKDAFLHERLLIDSLRSMGITLTNRTSGGEGYAGWSHSDITRKTMRESRLGFEHTNETKSKISDSLKKQVQSDETREKKRQTMIAIWSDPVRKAKHLAIMRSEECRKKISDSMKIDCNPN